MKKKRTRTPTADGFANLAARLGVGADNLLSQGVYVKNAITQNQVVLDNLYRGSWIIGKVVDAVAEDMTRAGITITGDTDPKNVQKLQTALTRLHVWNSLLDGIKWGRLYGGAISFIVVDGQAPDSELTLESVQKGQFKGLAVYDRWRVTPDVSRVIESGPNMGLPLSYTLLGEGTIKPITMHHTRVIRHIGIQLPWRQALTEQFWGESEVERLYDRLLPFDSTTMGAASLAQRAHLRTVSVHGLRDILSTGGQAEENLIKMFKYMAYLQNSEGITLLDKEDVFDAHSYTFAGLSDIIMQMGQQISGASGIPLVRLFGQSPAGLNSTGESDLRMYYDGIHAQQESRLRDGLFRVLRVLHQSVLGKDADEAFDFEFAPLWQLNDEQRSKLGTEVTASVGSAYEKGLITLPTALRELRQMSATTGLFTNITDQDITDAEHEPPPQPGIATPPLEGAGGKTPEMVKGEEADEDTDQDTKRDKGNKVLDRIQAWLKS